MPRTMTGSEIVLQALKDQGVKHIFGYPGGAVLPIYDQLYQQEDLQHILVRHEQGAVHAAEGYARSTDKVGVVLVTSGPGATNAVTGLTDALMDSIPIVCITGQVPTHLIGNDAFQECDTVGITRPCTKHNYLVRNVDDLSRVLHEAFYVASSGRPGPVVVDIPKDVQFATGTYIGRTNVVHKTYRPKMKGDEAAIREAVVLSAALMTSEESYSGGKAELSQLALDQLQNGIYLTESEEVEALNPITKQVTTQRIVRIKLDKDGNRLRKVNTLASYGIEVTQLFFPDDFAYETKILEQIGNVRDAQMKATAAFARAEAAAQDEKTAAAEGRANVAMARAAAEVEKQKAVTAAEQARDVAVLAAESRKKVASEDALAAAQEKRANILRGEGEATRKKLVMAADGALQQKLAAYVETQKVWADAFARRNVPTTVFGASGVSGGDSDASAFMQLMTLQAAKQLSVSTEVR